MNFPYEWQIAWRYTRSGKYSSNNHFISFIAFISIAGITLGVSALIIVLSIMNGFQVEVRDRMLAVLSHIEVVHRPYTSFDWHTLATQVKQNPEVRAAAPYIEAQAVLTRNQTVQGVIARGILPAEESQVSDLTTHLSGSTLSVLEAGTFRIILGKALAQNLGVHLGDKITLLAPARMMTPIGMVPRIKPFTVSGFFSSGHFEYDSTLALIALDDAKSVFRLSEPSGLRLKIADMQKAPWVAQQLRATLPADFIVRDWTEQNKTWFLAVQTEKRMMFIILTLIIAVAAFNLVSSLVMTVTDKHADIAILRTMGAMPASIMKIFMIQGCMIGMIGSLFGIGLGSLIAYHIPIIVPWIERLFHLQFLPQEIYFISALPSDLRLQDVMRVGGVAFFLSFLATLYPSWRAARIQPAQALRYE